MNMKDRWRFVRRNMKRSKSRIFMTVLATAMGVTFLIVLASVGFGLHKSLAKDILESRSVTQLQIGGMEVDGKYQPITDKEIEELEKKDGMKAVTRRINLQQTPLFQLDQYEGSVQTVMAHFPSEIDAGLELSEGRLPEKENEIIVGHDFVKTLVSSEQQETEDMYGEDGMLKKEFQYDGEVIGKELKMTVMQTVDGEQKEHTIPLIITGITEKPARDWMMDQTVFISDSILKEVEAFTKTARGMITQPDMQGIEEPEGYDEVRGYAHNMEEVSDISEQLKDQGYLVYSAADELKSMDVVFTIAKAGLIFIGTIAIIIASIGIYNTMTMAVTERTPDIGIMKALGAHPKKIKQIFLLESGYIGILGAVVGIAVAYLISFLVNLFLPVIVENAFDEQLPEGFQFSAIPWSLIAISVAICLLVTIVSGLKPAKRATKIDVLKAMRREI
ncbi:ABC transporter permease [Gracilibacillus dipsosauri]|uniref:Metabolite permease n=1 Tax=Gracilibacillus dipsosauri TaxID=178340 RepID=A0A317KX23_9BACI|nr:FtsX-like permease family protein [Gracilibacillus dipsosauri]PWU68047.1 metabolite permease [Gracilibacillus dipsosauri]